MGLIVWFSSFVSLKSAGNSLTWYCIIQDEAKNSSHKHVGCQQYSKNGVKIRYT